MLMFPLPENKYVRNSLLIHELFHRVQPNLSFDNILESNNNHLDTKDARVWLRLELNALKKALLAANPLNQKLHLKNAISFRLERYVSKEIKKNELIEESYEEPEVVV